MMQMPSMLEAARGAFSCPPIENLRELARSNLPLAERRRVAFDNVIALRAFMDSQFNSAMFGTVLGAARLKDSSIPSKQQWLLGWGRIKQKMASDGKYTALICEKLPGVLARYDLANAAQLFTDPDIRDLVRRGLS